MSDVTGQVAVGNETATVVDCRGTLCPVPIIRLSKAVKGVQIGQLVKMIAIDPGSQPDMRAWEKQTGNAIVSSSTEGKEFHFVVRRTR